MRHIYTVGEKEVSLQEIRREFEFAPGLFSIVLRGGYLYGAWPRTVLILIEFKFIVQELWHIVVLCTCRILSEGLKFENFSLQKQSRLFILERQKKEPSLALLYPNVSLSAVVKRLAL